MATINKGILGGFSGKVGTVVGFSWRGKDVIRSLPKTGQRTPSEKQLLQQKKFSLVIAFLQPLQSLLSRFYGNSSGSKSRINLAVSYTIQNALQVIGNEPILLFNKVIVSKGELTGFQNFTSTTAPGGVVDLAWEDNSQMGNASPDDKLYLVFYSDELKMYQLYEGISQRLDTELSITLPNYMIGQEVQLYVFLSDVKDIMASNSFYAGQLLIS